MPDVLGRSRLLLSLLKLGISKVRKSIGKEEKTFKIIYVWDGSTLHLGDLCKGCECLDDCDELSLWLHIPFRGK